jgi:membrane fusion protein (multidrug efflux system)
VQVDIKKAAVLNAEADARAAEAQVRATLGQARSQRWALQSAIEQVDNYVALLRARVAPYGANRQPSIAPGPT